MADNKQKTGHPDRIRINFHESYEVKYWTQKWNISTQQLHGAHKATGSVMVKKIATYLEEKGAMQK